MRVYRIRVHVYIWTWVCVCVCVCVCVQGQLLQERRARHASGEMDATGSFHGGHLHLQDRHMVSLPILPTLLVSIHPTYTTGLYPSYLYTTGLYPLTFTLLVSIH